MAMQTLALFFLVTLAAGGVAWVFVYPILSGERKAEQRQERVVRTEPVARAATGRNTPKVRREQVEDTLKELEIRNKKQKNLPLALRISQAGLAWSKRQFMIVSAIFGAVLFVVKFAIDWTIATQGFGQSWSPLNYLIWPNDRVLRVFELDDPERLFSLTMLFVSLPFIWTGVILTLHRLRATGLTLPLFVTAPRGDARVFVV